MERIVIILSMGLDFGRNSEYSVRNFSSSGHFLNHVIGDSFSVTYDYYSFLWEAQADKYGGVYGRTSYKRKWTSEDGYYDLGDLILELFL